MRDHAVKLLIDALLFNNGELTKSQCMGVLHAFDEERAQAAIAELEAEFHMQFNPRTRVYECPLVLRLFRPGDRRLRLLTEAI